MHDRRNTEIGHLQIDYRNSCAMIKFLHKPCHTDGINSIEIAQKMKTKIKNVKMNELEQLLHLRMGTKKFPFIKMSEVTDFPRFTKSEMIEKIFFGSYYIDRSKSYLGDIMENDVCIVLDENCITEIINSNKDSKKE